MRRFLTALAALGLVVQPCAVKWGENATAGEIVTLVMSAWRKPERWLLVALIFSRSFQSETSHFFVLLFEEEGGSSLQCLL